MLRVAVTLILCSVICTVSCSSLPVKDTKSDENLRARVEALYAYREAGDYLEAYKLENMSLDGKFSAKDYATGFKSKGISNVKIKDVQIENNTAIVTIKATVLMPRLKGFEGFNPEFDYEFKDKWVFRNNNWYHIISTQAGEW